MVVIYNQMSTKKPYVKKSIMLELEQSERLRRLSFNTRKSEGEIIRLALDTYLELQRK